jgi:CelD/BcsL family acetyltransferase involved in cellulose biosynthesis
MAPLRTRICTEDRGGVVDPAAWDALTARPPASLCGSRGWAAAAFEAAHPEARPLLVVVERGDLLLGLLSLAVHGREDGERVVRFAGAPHNDMTDLMVLPGSSTDVATAALAALQHLHEEGFSLQLDALDPDGSLAAAGPPARALEWRIDEPAPVVDLKGPWSAAASPRRRKQWERKLRRLTEAHAVEFRMIDGPRMLDELVPFGRLREARRLATGRERDLPPTRFFEAVVRRLCHSGACAFFEMVVDGAPVARDLYLLDPPVAMMWLRALDPVWQQAPCGHLLLRETAGILAAAGYETLDLGRGAETYKFFFGTRERRLLSACAAANADRESIGAAPG